MKRKLFLLFLFVTSSFTLGCAVNPVTGQKQLMFIPENQDVEIGRKYAPEIEKQLGGKIPDEYLQNYINRIGSELARKSHRPDWPYKFIALQDKSVNAFALPGGFVFITKGMLQKLQNEAQLSAILAHEIVHVVARHSSAAMSKQIGFNLLISAVSSEKTSENALMVTDLTWKIITLQYSREDERLADLTGLDYLVSAGYNPYAMAEVMKMLQQQNEKAAIEFFSTHPSPQNRIRYITQKIQKKYTRISQLKIGENEYQKNVLNRLEN